MGKRRKSKRPKLNNPGYFSDTEGSGTETENAVHVEEVESYRNIDGKLSVTSTTFATVKSPKRQRTQRASVSGVGSTGSKRPRCDNSSDDFEEMSFLEDETRGADPSDSQAKAQTTGQKKKPKRKPRKSALLEFIPCIDMFVEEMLRLEGMGNSFGNPICKDCNTKVGVSENVAYRCLDCDPNALWCKGCCVSSHTHTYLHRVEAWNGGCFEKSSLRELGLRVQLGHLTGVCPHRGKDPGVEFVIIDSDAIHVVMVDYCCCDDGVSRVQQLLRARLLPATMQNPRTAATFRALETFQMLSFTGKVSAFEFLMSIRRRTDNTTTFSVKDRNREWMRMVHLFRHIRMLKRGGRGHTTKGVAETQEGELAVLCPACPQAGINMPKDWELLPQDQLWIHALFLAIDANFRLKRRCSSSDENDPGLNHGFAYIVAEVLFKSFLNANEKKIKEEKSNCSNHDAIKSAQVRKGKGEKAASGLGACQCARHDMKRPCGAGDLQKGERYINMDYFVLSTLRFAVLAALVISYDIACQWSRNLIARCLLYPPNPISENPHLKPTFCVPKFHAPAHVLSCRINYSFNLTPGVGRTDGEAPERGWSSADDLVTSTREMGPGNRRDTFDDFFGFINWVKSVLMGETLGERGRVAFAMSIKQGNAFKVFAASIPHKTREDFTKQVKGWEGNRSLPNPHENPEIKIDVKQTRLRLSKEDKDAIAAGLVERVHAEMTGSLFILEGIEIEETQRRVQLECGKLGEHSTDLDRSKAQEHVNALHRKLKAFIDMRRVFLPCTVLIELDPDEPTNESPIGDDTDPIEPTINLNGDSALVDEEPEFDEEPWEIELHLPSDLLGENRKCDRRFVRYEFLFRISQAHVALKELRAQLLQQDHMVLSKTKYTRGTAMLTMSNALLRDTGARIKEEKRRYRNIRKRLVWLWDFLKDAGPLDDLKEQLQWVDVLKELKTGDAKGLTCLDGGQLGEGTKALPWIWQVGADAKETANISLRVEFCRARARVHRWQEECLLLAEEMRRVERFWAWDAKRWQNRAASQPSVAEAQAREQAKSDKEKGITREPLTDAQQLDQRAIIQGKMAYAIRQARIRTRLLEEAKRQCEGLPALLESGPPLIECGDATITGLIPVPEPLKKPMRPGGRKRPCHTDQKPGPRKEGSTDDLDAGTTDEEGDIREYAAAPQEDVTVPPEDDEEEMGKTYDDTDSED